MNQTITGTGFTGATLVTYVSAERGYEYEPGVGFQTFTIVSDTEILVRDVPTDFDGTCWGVFDIEVTTPGGTGTLADGFRVGALSIDTVTPDPVPLNAAQVLTITGRDFDLVTSATYQVEGRSQQPLPYTVTDALNMTANLPALDALADVPVVLRITSSDFGQTTQKTIRTVAA